MNVVTRAAWITYEAESRRARDEYYAHPSARPRIAGLHFCLGCDVLTEQPAVCLLCQSRDPEMAAVAADPELAIRMRRYYRDQPAKAS